MASQPTRSGHTEESLPYEHRNSIIAAADGSEAQSLTDALLNAHQQQFIAATQVPFLKAAGCGKLPRDLLSKWLSQDRLYAETYICFITSLIARIHLPYSFVEDKSKSLRWRMLRLLTGALQNIHQEIEFFTQTAQKYNLDLQLPTDGEDSQSFAPVQATQQYIDLFRSFQNDPTLPLIEGMVVLWATEQCYLSAWTYASQFLEDSPEGNDDADGGALRQEFIPNWTSKEFKSFVDEIAELTNLLAEREKATKKLEVYKAVWSHVLDIETRFWPVVLD